MKKTILKAMRWTLGAIMILIGITGLFLPLLPGIILILAGIFLIDEPLYQKIKDKVKKKFKR